MAVALVVMFETYNEFTSNATSITCDTYYYDNDLYFFDNTNKMEIALQNMVTFVCIRENVSEGV